MNDRRFTALELAVLALVGVGLACGPNFTQATETLSPDQLTQQALGATAMALTELAADSGPEEPAATEAPPSEPTAEPGATATVVHVTIPTNPGSISSFMTDRSTRALAGERRAIGDNFDTLLFERPFTAQSMDYLPYIDITRAELSASGAWFYVTIFLEEGAPAEATPYYGVEIDIDIDGRGDWLIWGLVPPGTDWTTDGMLALRDTGNDVGDQYPVRSEPPPQAGNGYEDLVFDSGQGLDPDAAWIRRSPSSPSQIQIAFKQTLIGPPGSFLWGAWSDEGVQDPAAFDYHDHFSIQQAGSPASDSSYYPLNEMARMDNTCRWGYGFTPVGTEPGACFIPPTPTATNPPSATPTPTNTPVIIF